jgi:hypothetical protein
MMLRELEQHDNQTPIAENVMKAIVPMNAAAHGFEVSEDEAKEAERAETLFLKQSQEQLN